MGVWDNIKKGAKEFEEGLEEGKKGMDSEGQSLGSSMDFRFDERWKSVDVVERDEWHEPKVLQQAVKYPTSQKVTETKAPLDKHRLVPLSELAE